MWNSIAAIKTRFSIAVRKALQKNVTNSRSLPKQYATTANTEKDGFRDYNSAKPFKEIPILTRLPVIGTAGHQLPCFGTYDLELQFNEGKRFVGDIFREKFGSRDIVVSFSREDLETLYKYDEKYGRKLNFPIDEDALQIFKKEDVQMIEKEWYRLRDFARQSMLTPNGAKTFLNSIHAVSVDFIKRMDTFYGETQETQDLMKEMYRWALESIFVVGLNTRIGCLDLPPRSDGKRMFELLMSQFECMQTLEGFAGSLQLWKSLPINTMARYQRSAAEYNRLAIKHFDGALSDLAKTYVKQHADKSELQPTFLMNWLKEGLDTKTAMLVFLDILLTGVQTTSHAAGFLLYHLAKNPKKQELMFEELREILQPSNDGSISYETYDKLKYSKACLKESLRLTPVVGGIIRACSKNLVISGYQVPAGTLIALGFQPMSLNEEEFDDPEEFIPERFLVTSQQASQFSLLPFGGIGPRTCVGRRIAQQEVICLVTEILKKYRLEYHGDDVDVYAQLTCRPTSPIKMTFIRR
ncbi:probable cytochrome P450 49a1 isoform X2 [Parasteatoda tepidariorum]|nr:probable cytochrome P450 49a1 [Parasteatoda tepidariorum]